MTNAQNLDTLNLRERVVSLLAELRKRRTFIEPPLLMAIEGEPSKLEDEFYGMFIEDSYLGSQKYTGEVW